MTVPARSNHQVDLRTMITTGSVNAAGDALEPNPWVEPGPGDTGFDVRGAYEVDVDVGLHEDVRTRTVYLVVHPDAGLGDYVVQIGGATSTYDATAGAPADLQELLEAWAAQIQATLGPTGTGAISSATVAPWGVDEDQLPNAVKIVGVLQPAAYTSFSIGANTSAPATAQLHIWREPDRCEMDVFARTGDNTTKRHRTTAGLAGCRKAWKTPARGRNLAVPRTGYFERLEVPGLNEVWIHLKNVETIDDELSLVSVGDGIYKATWLVSAVGARARE